MKPILFNTEMVRAILEGRKTVTRRVVKPQPVDTDDCHHEMQTYDRMLPQFYKGDYSCVCRKCGYGTQPNGESVFQPIYRPGDILYVRETFRIDYLSNIPGSGRIHYKADDTYADFSFSPARYEMMRRAQLKPGWRPNENMPHEAARIFLRVTDVRVERLQEIANEQAQAEGVKGWMVATDRDWDKNPNYILAFRYAWDSTIKKADRALYGWEADPWVWVIEFERISREEVEA